MKVLSALVIIGAFIFLPLYSLQAQLSTIDSLHNTLYRATPDTNKANALYSLATEYYRDQPDSALSYALEALQLSKSIMYDSGVSKSSEFIAVVLTRLGNYEKSLMYYIEALKIEEKIKSTHGIASIKVNMGIAYTRMQDFAQAYRYLDEADSLVKSNKELATDELSFLCLQNLGDLYDNKGELEKAYNYYTQAAEWAKKNNNKYNAGRASLGLARVLSKKSMNDSALINYRNSLNIMLEEKDNDLICEGSVGIANLFKQLNRHDSSFKFARLSLNYAEKDGSLPRTLEAGLLLSELFKLSNNFDSAYIYLSKTNLLKDSILGIEKLRNYQSIAFNENVRQLELADKERKEAEGRKRQLQHIIIALFIPTFILITIFISRAKVSVKLVRFLGVASLLLLFEYITVLLHPKVAEFSHHQPLIEVPIFVALASIIIPFHHKLEHWLIERLLHTKKPDQLGKH